MMRRPLVTREQLYAAIFAVNVERYHARGPRNCDRENSNDPRRVVQAFEQRCVQSAHDNAMGQLELYEKYVARLPTAKRTR